MEIKDEGFVPAHEAKKALERKAKDKELGYEQKNALEYLKAFAKLTEAKAKAMKEDLEALKLQPKHIAMVMDFLPETQEEVKALFSSEVINLSEEDRKKVAAAVSKNL